MVFRVDAVTFDLDFSDVCLTIFERFETFWAYKISYLFIYLFLKLTFTQLCGIPRPISVKHLLHITIPFAGGDLGVLLGFPTGLECSATYFLYVRFCLAKLQR